MGPIQASTDSHSDGRRRKHSSQRCSSQQSTLCKSRGVLIGCRRLVQLQQMRLNSTNSLLCALQTNHLLSNDEAANGLLPASDEDKELEDDDG